MASEPFGDPAADMAGLLRSLREAVVWEAANFVHGVTPAVWDGRREAAPGAGPEAAIARPRAAQARPEPARRPAVRTMPLFEPQAREAAHAAPAAGPAREKLPAGKAAEKLEELKREIGPGCARCKLSGLGRSKVVFGVGSPVADLVFVGEGPGEDEDRQGEPFVGKAGQLLNKMIAAMGLKREDVYICNVVKCRPPGNRDPEWDEMDACGPFMKRQIEIIRPRAIVTLGKISTMYLRDMRGIDKNRFPISRYRGNMETCLGAKMMITYHPSYLLRSPSPENKRAVWSDLQQVMKLLGLRAPAREA